MKINDVPVRTEWDAVELVAHEFPPIRWAVEGLVPEGAGLITGAPKSGKSLLVRDMALAVATGSSLWDRHHTTRGTVLWFALEDGARRVRARIDARPEVARLLRPGDLTVRTVSKRLPAGGLEEIEQWLERENGKAALVIIDVFARVREDTDHRSSVYAADYAAVEPLQNLAGKYAAAMPIVHHNRKIRPGDDDPFESISGTQGLLGGVDFALVLTRRRGDDVGMLYGTGRDLDDVTLVLDFHDGRWSRSSMPAELATKSMRVRALWRRLDEAGPSDTKTIAGWYGQNMHTTTALLRRLLDEALVDQLETPAPGRPARWMALRA